MAPVLFLYRFLRFLWFRCPPQAFCRRHLLGQQLLQKADVPEGHCENLFPAELLVRWVSGKEPPQLHESQLNLLLAGGRASTAVVQTWGGVIFNEFLLKNIFKATN